MLGDIKIWIKLKIKQFKCDHDYKIVLARAFWPYSHQKCTECGRTRPL